MKTPIYKSRDSDEIELYIELVFHNIIQFCTNKKQARYLIKLAESEELELYFTKKKKLKNFKK